MKPAKDMRIVLVTTPSIAVARSLAKACLESKLVACANLLPKIESHYWWQGKLEHSDEVLIVFKTSLKNLAALEKLILAQHPYDTPEIVSLSVNSATMKYLDWWQASLVSQR